jgi:hypothetical protein
VRTTFLLFSPGQHDTAGASITGGEAPIGALTSAFDDTFILMSCVTVVGMGLALFLKDPFLDKAREDGQLPGATSAKVPAAAK